MKPPLVRGFVLSHIFSLPQHMFSLDIQKKDVHIAHAFFKRVLNTINSKPIKTVIFYSCEEVSKVDVKEGFLQQKSYFRH